MDVALKSTSSSDKDWDLIISVKSPGRGTSHAEIALDRSAHHIFPMLLPSGTDRLRFREVLRDAGIQFGIHHQIQIFSYYRGRYDKQYLPRTEDIAACEVTLPFYPTMGEEKVEMVVETVEKLLRDYFRCD